MATTYNNLYLDTRKRLRAAGVEGAQLEARELVCFALEKTKEQLYRDMNLYVTAQQEAKVEELVQRRLAGEPVAYIIGEWEFYGLPLDISPDVLVPRMDTEVLAERAITLIQQAGEGARILDLCAGSGCVGLAVAANASNCRAVLADLSEGALRICRQNVRRNGLNARVTCIRADAREAAPSTLWDFDVIACNPPYIPTADIDGLDITVRDFEPRMALDGGADGLDFYRDITAKWKSALRLGGTLMFEVGIGQAPRSWLKTASPISIPTRTPPVSGGWWRALSTSKRPRNAGFKSPGYRTLYFLYLPYQDIRPAVNSRVERMDQNGNCQKTCGKRSPRIRQEKGAGDRHGSDRAHLRQGLHHAAGRESGCGGGLHPHRLPVFGYRPGHRRRSQGAHH